MQEARNQQVWGLTRYYYLINLPPLSELLMNNLDIFEQLTKPL
jgi:hypothetical protein